MVHVSGPWCSHSRAQQGQSDCGDQSTPEGFSLWKGKRLKSVVSRAFLIWDSREQNWGPIRVRAPTLCLFPCDGSRLLCSDHCRNEELGAQLASGSVSLEIYVGQKLEV